MLAWLAASSTLLLAVTTTLLARTMRRMHRAECALARVSLELGQARHRSLVRGQELLRLQPLDPLRMLASLRLFLERFVSAGIDLIVRVDPGTPAMLGDPAQIERVIVSLVSNAAHALDETSARHRRIVVRLGFERLDAVRAQLLKVRAGGYVRITVEDNGPGLDEEDRTRLVTAFGNVIEQQGGGIALVSQPHHGSRFDVYVPAADD